MLIKINYWEKNEGLTNIEIHALGRGYVVLFTNWFDGLIKCPNDPKDDITIYLRKTNNVNWIGIT